VLHGSGFSRASLLNRVRPSLAVSVSLVGIASASGRVAPHRIRSERLPPATARRGSLAYAKSLPLVTAYFTLKVFQAVAAAVLAAVSWPSRP
jgi:hypothetical protein